MTVSLSSLPFGLSLRPSRPSDGSFLRNLHRSTRNELLLIDGDQELIESIFKFQYDVHENGAGNKYPDAMSFIIEKTGDRIGGLVIDFGHDEIRVPYLAFLPAARAKGYGKGLMSGIVQAARVLGKPVRVMVLHGASAAYQIYRDLGFQIEENSPIAASMVWYPGRGISFG